MNELIGKKIIRTKPIQLGDRLDYSYTTIPITLERINNEFMCGINKKGRREVIDKRFIDGNWEEVK